jgi:hypothetical protein
MVPPFIPWPDGLAVPRRATNTKDAGQTTCGIAPQPGHAPVRAAVDTARTMADPPPAANTARRGQLMEIVVLPPLVALIAGILILIVPRLLNYIVAIYLILVGLLGLLGHYSG